MPRADHDSIPEQALIWHRAGQGAAIATVVETWGSAPRQAGSQLAISGQGQMLGSVSGGCVEGAVVAEAMDAIADGIPRLLTFGVTDDTAFAVGLACGGTIRVLVDPVGDAASALPESLLLQLVEARRANQPIAIVTRLETWNRSIMTATDDVAVAARLRSDKSGLEDDGRFIAVHNPPLRMIIVGAVHIAQPLVTIARSCGYDCTLIDPRAAFGSADRFPGEVILDDWPDEAMAALAPDARTALITLTHDPKLDDPAISAGLGTPAFYIGCLGSKKTHAGRLERLAAAGFVPEQIARIHAPVGLDIGAKTPAEIAVSIMAEVTLKLRRG